MKKDTLQEIVIHTEKIQLDQLLKFAGIIQTGGQMKALMEAHPIMVNGELCTAKRKQLFHGDIVDIEAVGSFIVVRETA